MTTARNVAILVALAAAVAFVPGGGDAAALVSRTLSLAFIAVIAWSLAYAYRRFGFDLDALRARDRALLYGAIAAIVLVLAGAGKLTATGTGAVVLIVVVLAAIAALMHVWRRHRSLG